MTRSGEFVWQPSLLDSGAAGVRIDDTFAMLRRIRLDETSWVDVAPGWVLGSDLLFDELLTRVEWGQRSRHMYDQVVDEPRLTALWRASAQERLAPPLLERMRTTLSDHYGVRFDSVGLNLYRDGRDSVAWHRDRIAGEIADPVVALVSIGEPRRFLLRPRGGRTAATFRLGHGDLLVTGGSAQRAWEHCVPKVAAAGPRISIAFRHGLDDAAYPGKN